MTNVKYIIKKYILEALGIQDDVNILTKLTVPLVVQNFTKSIKFFVYNIEDKDIIKHTGISIILFRIMKSSKFGGSFLYRDSELLDDGSYKISISLDIEDISDIKTISSIVNHELNDAFVFIKKVNKNSKTLKYNQVNRMMSFEYGQYPPLKEFTHMLYLNLPEEIQARVQETASILDDIHNKNIDDVIRELYLHQPINDAKKMVHYNGDDIYDLDRSILSSFIDVFNKNSIFHNIEGYKEFIDVEKFFDFWIKHINKSGDKLNRKILKLVADKFNIKEQDIIYNVDVDILTEILIKGKNL